MPYAILRTKKLKSLGALARSLSHTFRDVPTPNADPAKTPRNQLVGSARAISGSAGALAEIRERLPEKRRKDAVMAIEYLITASPEAFRQHGGKLREADYFNGALAWLRERHGRENIIVGAVHRDETTPHLVVYVVPRTADGRLSAKDYLGGPDKLRAMQDSFHAACGAPQGLERGVRGSKAKHEPIRRFYQRATAAVDLPPLTRADYAKAALGIETPSFAAVREAAAAARQQAAQARDRTKAVRSRQKALDGRETALDSRDSSRAAELDRREWRLSHKAALVDERETKLDTAESQAVATARQLRETQAALDAERRKSAELAAKLAALQPKPKPRGPSGPQPF